MRATVAPVGRRRRCGSIWLLGVAAAAALSACSQFAEGVRAMTGRGGTSQERDVIAETAPIARDLATYQPKPVWTTTVEADACDLLEIVDDARVLVGAVEVSAYLATPAIGPLRMYHRGDGRLLWQAPRKALDGAAHAVLATSPRIVAQATSPATLHLSLLDPDDGRELGHCTVPQPAAVLLDVARGLVVIASARAGVTEVRALRLADGALAWQLAVPGAATHDAIDLLPTTQGALLVHDRLSAIDLEQGRLAAAAAHPDPGAGSQVHASDAGVLLVRGSRVWLADASASLRWGPVDVGGRILRVDPAAVPGSVCVVARLGDAPYLDTIHALSLVDGRASWRREVRTMIEGSLLHAAGNVAYTTPTHVEAVATATGEPTWRTPLPMAWALNELPDLLRLRGANVVVARERMGVAAFAAADGRPAWSQTISPWRAAHYWFKTREVELFQAAGMAQGQQEIASRERAWWGGFLASWDHFHKTRDVGAARASTVGITSQWQATMALNNALLALGAVIEQSLRSSAIEALIQRKRIELDGTVRLHARTFQGDHWLRMFGKRGDGISIVDLDTGRRADFEPCAPHYGADVYGPRVGVVAIDAERGQLLTVGVELQSDRWQRYVKYKWGMPWPALQCFRLADLQFRERVYDDEDLPAAAEAGDAARVRQLLDGGVWIDARTISGTTALMAAAAKGDDAMVGMLLRRGCAVNAENNGGMSAIEIAAVWGHASTVRLLLEAGAAVGDAAELASGGKHAAVLAVLRDAGGARR